MIILDETEKLCLSHLYEHVQLIDKKNNQILFTDDFYGDPSCGFIDISNKWSIVAGKHLTLWTHHEGVSDITKFETQKFCDIAQLQIIDKNTIKILIDPWSEFSAIWQLVISDKSLSKTSDFTTYKNLPYTDDISW